MYIIEDSEGNLTKVDEKFEAANAANLPDGTEAVHVVNKSFTMQRTLVVENKQPRMYTMPDGTKKAYADMTQEEKDFANRGLKKARDARAANQQTETPGDGQPAQE